MPLCLSHTHTHTYTHTYTHTHAHTYAYTHTRTVAHILLSTEVQDALMKYYDLQSSYKWFESEDISHKLPTIVLTTTYISVSVKIALTDSIDLEYLVDIGEACIRALTKSISKMVESSQSF